MSRSDAYRAHVSEPGTEDKSIWEKASRLFNEGKVSARIIELRKKIDLASETECIMGHVEILAMHTRIARTPLADLEEDSDIIVERTVIEGREDTAIKTKIASKTDSLKEIARLRGYYAAQKVEVSSAHPEIAEALDAVFGPRRAKAPE